MKIYGYSKNKDELLLMDEISIQGTSEQVRELAAFFNKSADEMEQNEDWEHGHFKDFVQDELEADVIVVSSEVNG